MQTALDALNTLDTLGLAVWQKDLLSGNLRWNSSAYRLFLHEPDSFPVSVEFWREIRHPDEREATDAALTRLISENVPVQHNTGCGWQTATGAGYTSRPPFISVMNKAGQQYYSAS